MVGPAFSFDGIDDFVDIANTPSMDFGTGDFTIVLWISFNSLSTTQEIIHKSVGDVTQNTNKTYFLEYHVPTNGLRFRVSDISTNANDFLLPFPFVVRRWYHVAAVRRGNTSSLFVDGNLVGQRTSGNNIDTGIGGHVQIGQTVYNGVIVDRPLNGLVDELELYNRALCPSEIRVIFAAGSQGQCKDGTIGDTSCDDGNACTTGDTCSSGICLGGPPTNCDDNNVCTNDSCTPATGCVHSNNTAQCNDDNACTQTDSCQAGACIGSNPVVCTALDQCHVAGTCDTSSGSCSNPNKVDGSSCNDGNACTQSDTCQAGACSGGNPVVCVALDQCHDVGTCVPATGACTNPAKPNGTACNDGSACTTSDTCISGACVGGPPPPEICNALDDDCDGTIDEGCVGKVTGGGEIDVPGDQANFGFVAQRKAIGDPVMGQLEYHNHARGLNVHSTSILTLSVVGATATFTGECTKNQVPCTFSVTVEDNGEPGRNVDRFTIAVSGEPTEGASAPIIRGNIQIHTGASSQSLWSPLTMNQTPNALAGAGGGVFPGGTSFNGVQVTGLRFGLGIDMPGNGSANGTHETTLLGVSSLGQPQTITLEVDATSGYVTPSGDVFVSGDSRVDMGDGTPPRMGVQFSMTIATDAQGHPAMTLTVDTSSLPVATIDRGGVSPPACVPPPEVGTNLTLTNSTTLSWSASDAAASYNLYRGIVGGGSRPFDHVCLAPALPGPTATDTANPSSGQTFYYLVSGKNACGEGSLGAMSSGQARPNTTPCP